MQRIEYLYCPQCHMATVRQHPQADAYKQNYFNDMVKCNYCGYTACKFKHQERIDKLPKREIKVDKRKKYY